MSHDRFDFSKRPFVQFYAYSAFWDDRTSRGTGQPVVRVLAISTSATAENMKTDSVPLEYGVFCRFHMPDGRRLKPVSALPFALPIGYGWYLNSRKIREFLFDCPPPVDEVRPDAVTMLVGGRVSSTASKDDPETTACVPISYPEKPVVKGNFAICVQVTY